MPIYTIKQNRLEKVQEVAFKNEKEIQNIVEASLGTLFGLELVKSEFELNKLRIDSLAYDTESKSFVIIEYKRDRSQSVVDQGFAYLSLLLNNPDSFILEYAKKTNIPIQDIKLDQSQSRVMFLASSFNIHQQTAINFKDIPGFAGRHRNNRYMITFHCKMIRHICSNALSASSKMDVIN